jgi:hypothetical protein
MSCRRDFERWRPGEHGGGCWTALAPWLCVPTFRRVCSEQRHPEVLIMMSAGLPRRRLVGHGACLGGRYSHLIVRQRLMR